MSAVQRVAGSKSAASGMIRAIQRPVSGLPRKRTQIQAYGACREVPQADIPSYRIPDWRRFLCRPCLLLDRDRNAEGKRRALSKDRLHPDFSAVHLDNAF